MGGISGVFCEFWWDGPKCRLQILECRMSGRRVGEEKVELFFWRYSRTEGGKTNSKNPMTKEVPRSKTEEAVVVKLGDVET
jgi:hypothetical protein